MANSNSSLRHCQSDYERSLDSTDGPHNQNPTLVNNNTHLSSNQGLSYQGILGSSHQNYISHPNPAHTSNSDLNNNPSILNSNISSNNTTESRAQVHLHNTGNSNNIRRDFFAEIRNGGGHWSQLLRQVVLCVPPHVNSFRNDNTTEEPLDTQLPPIPIQISGGSEHGKFTMVGSLNSDFSDWCTVGYLQPGDILLDIQGQQVAGYTQADVLSLLHHCLQCSPAALTVAPRENLAPELRSYLNTRFQKGSVDHALQGVVRDNLYLRTVPVTTRSPKPEEIPGVDYTFLSNEEFMDLERNGSLLESGVYAGNHYGTPKPWARFHREGDSKLGATCENLNGDVKLTLLPGMHPSSEGKRKRNRSNVEALGAGTGDSPTPAGISHINQTASYASANYLPMDELGPLPSNWEMTYTEKGEVYFIDHNTGTSHWLDPRLSRVQKTALEDCADHELPFGWERIEDPHYGTYYIDHVNRRTQFENPVLQAKSKLNIVPGQTEIEPKRTKATPPVAPPKPSALRLAVVRSRTPDNIDVQDPDPSQSNHQLSMPTMSSSSVLRAKASGGRLRQNFFTRDPGQLVGERIQTALIKSARGLGFTIVGGDDDDGFDEFLQIKSVVSDGPAWRDGKLRTGDVLVCVNGCCVLGYTHQEMVSIFQSIGPGEEVELEVCRGYPLPFDPTDPNTEIVTTVAVAPISSADNVDKRKFDWRDGVGTPDSVAHSAHSLPELSTERSNYLNSNTGRPASVDFLLDNPIPEHQEHSSVQSAQEGGSVSLLTFKIVKGVDGFGFTIADSLDGQIVKKVSDPSRCGGLNERDRLVSIDRVDLRSLSHPQVVEVLKLFPLGREALLSVYRSHPNQNRAGNMNLCHTQIYPANLSPGTFQYGDTRRNLGMPRSKTPTADFGKNHSKTLEPLPERLKTPLVDALDLDQFNLFKSGVTYGTGDRGPQPVDIAQLPPVVEWRELSVELLRRQEGFGFRIVGGTEEGSQVSIGHVVPDGAADRDGRLGTYDQILSVDGVSVKGASHQTVVQLMTRASATGKVHLIIMKPIFAQIPNHPNETGAASANISSTFPSNSNSTFAGSSNLAYSGPSSSALAGQSNSIFGGPSNSGFDRVSYAAYAGVSQAGFGSGPMLVTLRRLTTEGFGFVIISSTEKAGATIGRIVEGSPADRCGQIHIGDRILAVNQVDLEYLHHSQIVQLIKDSGLALTLTVLPSNLTNESVQNFNAFPSQESSNHNDTLGVERLNLDHSGNDFATAFVSPECQPIHMDRQLPHPNSKEHLYAVHLTKGVRGFGFSIRGGSEFHMMPLFILRLANDGAAAVDGQMRVGDQILEINGFSTKGITHARAIEIIKSGENRIHMILKRSFLRQTNFAYGNSDVQDERQSVSSNNDSLQHLNPGNTDSTMYSIGPPFYPSHHQS